MPETTSSINYFGTFMSGGATLSLQGTANTTFGVMRASESYSLTGPSAAWYQANTVSGFEDQITINSLGLKGQPGVLRIGFLITGTQTENGRAQIAIFGPNPQQFQTQFVRVVPGGTTVVFNNPSFFQFTYGQQFDLNVLLGADIFLGINQPTSGKANYANTAILTQFQPLLSDQSTLAPSPTFIAASGTPYTPTGVAIPEPGSWVLLVAGLGAQALFRKRLSPLKKS